MDNPPVNAQNAQFNSEMAYVFDTLSDRTDVRVAVLTGAGKVFSAGADMKGRAGLTATGERWQHNRRVRESFHAIRECAKPVICALNGPALGAGLAVAASCDILACGRGELARAARDRRRPARRRHAMRSACSAIRRCAA